MAEKMLECAIARVNLIFSLIVNAVDGVLLLLCAVQPISIKLILLVTRLLVEN